jgi:hypothetical protein
MPTEKAIQTAIIKYLNALGGVHCINGRRD